MAAIGGEGAAASAPAGDGWTTSGAACAALASRRASSRDSTFRVSRRCSSKSLCTKSSSSKRARRGA
eukprot:15450364-Alexandrium_andersonii.AAC.1